MSPPPSRRAANWLLGCAAVLLTLAVAAASGRAITATAAQPRHTLAGAIPGAATATTTHAEIATECPRTVPGVSQSTRTVYRTAAGRTGVRTAYVAGPTRTVTATRAATAAVTAVRTVTATTTTTATVTGMTTAGSGL